MSLRTPRSTGDIASRRFCTHFDFPNSLHKPALPASPPPLPPLTTSQRTESSDSDDSDDDFHLDFPQPPSSSPALRRMRSSPWYSAQLAALDSGNPERRHSVSPLIPPAGARSRSQTHLQYSSSAGYLPPFLKQDHAPGMSTGQRGDPPGTCRLLRHPSHEEPPLPRRMERLPPPAPAPSIPLPRLPHIIRKVASMRSDSKHKSMEPQTSSRRPVQKIRSLKFLSGSGGTSISAAQSQAGKSRKRSWSLSRPTSLSGAKAIPGMGSSHANLNASASDGLRYVPARTLYASQRWPHDEGYSAPVAYRNPSFVRNVAGQPTNVAISGTEAWFDLSRGSAPLAPPFVHRTVRNDLVSSNATSSSFPYHSSSDTGIRYLYHPEETRGVGISRYPSGLVPSSHLLYGAGNRNESMNTNPGIMPQVPKSFINVTPERKGEGTRSKSRGGTAGFAAENARGTQMGAAMKQKGEKMRKLFFRASSGVADWGRQLTGRGSRSVPASSTSGDLAQLAGIQDS